MLAISSGSSVIRRWSEQNSYIGKNPEASGWAMEGTHFTRLSLDLLRDLQVLPGDTVLLLAPGGRGHWSSQQFPFAVGLGRWIRCNTNNSAFPPSLSNFCFAARAFGISIPTKRLKLSQNHRILPGLGSRWHSHAPSCLPRRLFPLPLESLGHVTLLSPNEVFCLCLP